MQPELFCLQIYGPEYLHYILKSPEIERWSVDPDLGFAHDVAYKTDDDAAELVARALTLEEARAARLLLLDRYPWQGPCDSRPQINFLCIDPLDPLAAFCYEDRRLRLLKWGDPTLERRLDGLSFARPSTREDAIRTAGKLFYRRAQPEVAQECYAVEATRIDTPALVVARYGHWWMNTSEPRNRTERFGFVEWDTFIDGDMEELLVGADRLLKEQEAGAIASLLASDANFRDIRITKGSLHEMDAGEGMNPCSDQAYSQAGEAAEAEVGFPFFLSVFPPEGEDEPEKEALPTFGT